jgi:Flp pilus assembly protein TadD
MLQAYRAGADTVEAVRQGLGVEPAELDHRFDAYLDGRFGKVAAALADLREALHLAQRAEQDKDWPAARAAAQRALSLYPEYVQADGGYLVLARAADAQGDPALLEATLTDYVARGGRSPWAMSRLAERHQSTGRLGPELSVRRTLARTLPLDGGVQRDLADRLAAAGRNEEALAAYQTTLALAPHDRAAVQLALAETLHRLGRDDEARRAVLQALELAPRYPAALELLLTLEGESIDHE